MFAPKNQFHFNFSKFKIFFNCSYHFIKKFAAFIYFSIKTCKYIDMQHIKRYVIVFSIRGEYCVLSSNRKSSSIRKKY